MKNWKLTVHSEEIGWNRPASLAVLGAVLTTVLATLDALVLCWESAAELLRCTSRPQQIVLWPIQGPLAVSKDDHQFFAMRFTLGQMSGYGFQPISYIYISLGVQNSTQVAEHANTNPPSSHSSAYNAQVGGTADEQGKKLPNRQPQKTKRKPKESTRPKGRPKRNQKVVSTPGFTARALSLRAYERMLVEECGRLLAPLFPWANVAVRHSIGRVLYSYVGFQFLLLCTNHI